MYRILLLLLPLLCRGHLPFSRQRLPPNVITNPTPSVRCEILIKQHQYKKVARLRAKALLRRSQALEQTTPPYKKSIHLKLRSNVQKLTLLASSLEKRLGNMEEQIVREGCPGLALYGEMDS